MVLFSEHFCFATSCDLFEFHGSGANAVMIPVPGNPGLG